MRNLLFILLFGLIGSYSYAQDLIITLSGDSVECKITRFEEEKLYFKLLTDDYKRSFDVSKLDKVIFQNGESVSFENDDYGSVLNPEPEEEKKEVVENIIIDVPDELRSLAKKGNRVFINSTDKAAATHLKNNLEYWGYWDFSPSLKMSDFILKIYVRYTGNFTYFSFAQFIDPKTNKVIYKTREVMSVKSAKKMDFNQKRSAVNVLFEKEIQAIFK
jgi:hypothetical protein